MATFVAATAMATAHLELQKERVDWAMEPSRIGPIVEPLSLAPSVSPPRKLEFYGGVCRN